MAQYDLRDFQNFEAKKANEVKVRQTWTWKDYHKKDNRALAAMKVDNPNRFKQLFRDEFGVNPRI